MFEPRYHAAAAAMSPNRGIDSARAQRHLFGAPRPANGPVNYPAMTERLASAAYRGGPAIAAGQGTRRFAGFPLRRILGGGTPERPGRDPGAPAPGVSPSSRWTASGPVQVDVVTAPRDDTGRIILSPGGPFSP